MVATVEPNAWLTHFFGREIREIKVASHELAKIHRLQTQGFQFVEGELDFVLDLNQVQPVTTKLPFFTACKATFDDIPALQALFGKAFLNSRFRSPWFSEAENQRFYQKWIENAVKGEFDDLCLVLKNAQQEIVAGVSLRFQGENARIGLLAVAPSQQGQGLGSNLMQLAIEEAQCQQAQQLYVATQSSNLNACRLYASFGAKLAASSYWFYPTFKDEVNYDPL